MINITKYSSKNMDVNSYILVNNNSAYIIDPGFNGKKLIEHLNTRNIRLEGVILTHGHYDHICDLPMLLNSCQPKIYIHRDELDFLYNPNLNLSSMFRIDFILDKNINVITLEDKEIIPFGEIEFKVIHLPGHTRGSMGVLYNQHFFSGDTLFFDSIGRTDLPTGSMTQIYSSLKKIKTTLSRNTIVYPGHGKGGRIQEVMQVNPYMNN